MVFDRFKSMPIRGKLLSIILITTGISLGILSVFLLVTEFMTFRDLFIDRLKTQAEIINYSSRAALMFGDRKDAGQTLASLSVDDNTLCAVIYDAEGTVFANYSRYSTSVPATPKEQKDEFYWLDGFVQIAAPMLFDNEQIGWLLIQSSLGSLYRRLMRDILMLLGAMMVAMAVGYILATKFRNLIATPILEIKEVMKNVAEQKDYRLRVETHSPDEIGVLANGLNEMLSQIQKRDDELEEHRYNLTDLIKRRTADLEKANVRLLEELEHRIKAEEGRLRLAAAIEQTEEGIFLTDPGWIIQYTNPAFEKMLGYAQGELLGWHTRNLKSGRHDGTFYRSIKETLSLGDVWKGQAVNTRKDGSIVHVEATMSPVKDASGSVINYVGIHRDITEEIKAEEERKELQARLQRAEKMEALGTLAGGVAHDLNNVVGVLVGFSELLLLKHPEESYARNILQGGQRAAAIIQDLLTLARRGVMTSEVVNLNQVICDFMQSPELQKIRSYNPDACFDVQLDPELLNIKGSRIHMGKTVMNLLLNAVEAISGKGTVSIATGNVYLDKPLPGYDKIIEGEYAVVSVSDSGVGISQEDLGRIFEPFYTKKVMGRSGTGLGLAVVWGTVKDHNGYINVQSEEGRGTTFSLYFPLSRESIRKQSETVSRKEYEGSGERILVVDDVEGQRLLAVSMLEGLGYAVEAVPSGEEAIQYLAANSADLVILDMIMDPGLDGLDTYREIVRIRPRQKAIIVSGYALTERVRMTQELGAGAYVRKPYIMEELGLAVRSELRRPA
jgi:PAS domain S-box-containing protein